MVRIGDVVCHPNAGVCRVEEVKQQRFAGMEPRDYYVLRPLYATAATTVYTPVGSDKVRLRRLMDREEIDLLFARVPQAELEWQPDDRLRQQQFREILYGDDAVQVVRLILLLHREEDRRREQGKQLRATDKKVLTEAKRLLHQEFAYALDLTPDQVAPYIRDRLHMPQRVPAGA